MCFIRILGCGYRRDSVSNCTVRPDCSYSAGKCSTKATKIVTYVNLFVSQNSLSSISVSLLPSVCLCFITADVRCLWCLSDVHLFVLSSCRLNSASFDKNSELVLRCLSVCLVSILVPISNVYHQRFYFKLFGRPENGMIFF